MPTPIITPLPASADRLDNCTDIVTCQWCEVGEVDVYSQTANAIACTFVCC